jgi:antitoxin (DNA-binding transcriptional repressor) of toxin-antitoxin stability system
MYHMKRASIRDLRYRFKEVEASLAEGEEIEIVRRNKPIAVLSPPKPRPAPQMPDFLARLRRIHGDKILQPSGAELIAEERDRF